jgi:hypothetical protein
MNASVMQHQLIIILIMTVALLAMVSDILWNESRHYKESTDKVKIIPRTMYEDQMGIMWTSEGSPLV